MGEASSPSRALVRIIVVLALTAFTCLLYLPDLTRVFGTADGDLGMALDEVVVVGVVRGGPADRAGVRAGDKIDFSANPPVVVQTANQGFTPTPDTADVAKLSGAAGSRTVVIHSVAEPASRKPLVLEREVLFRIPIAFGVVLVLLRPSPATWSFFLFSWFRMSSGRARCCFRLLGPAGSAPTL